ncbi:MAG: hypothetical protein EBZ49_12090, partial [Proteobacteria bacterium]|nr:hypothetical protein [Pseudomonadota bacterium]
MRLKGWLIVAGLLLLWIAPAILVFIRPSTPKEDQTKAWSAYFKAERKRQHDYAMEVYRGRYYTGSYSRSSSSQPEPETEVVVVEKPVYIDRPVEAESSSYRRQPNLSGFYYSVPMSGPNTGD